MQAILVPTYAMYTRYISILLDLGYVNFSCALNDEILNLREYNFLTKMFGGNVPSEQNFMKFQQQQFNEIRGTF